MVHMDLKYLNIIKELHLQQHGNIYIKPPTCYTLTSVKRKKFCKFLKLVKLPEGYASNISRCVSIYEGKILGLKSHHCYVLLQRLLPIGIRAFLRKDVCTVLVELCKFFQDLCAKTLNVSDLDILDNGIVFILC